MVHSILVWRTLYVVTSWNYKVRTRVIRRTFWELGHAWFVHSCMDGHPDCNLMQWEGRTLGAIADLGTGIGYYVLWDGNQIWEWAEMKRWPQSKWVPLCALPQMNHIVKGHWGSCAFISMHTGLILTRPQYTMLFLMASLSSRYMAHEFH